MARGTIPILVGAAQVVQHWQGAGVPDDALTLMVRASRAAIADAAGARLAATIDWVAVVNTIMWSYEDAPGALAGRLGLTPRRLTYTTIGGNTPQSLVNRAAEALAQGRCRTVLLAGGEAGDALAQARKLKLHFDTWPKRGEPRALEGDTRLGASATEGAYDLFLPSAMYPLIETTIRAASGLSPEAHRQMLGHLFARFAAVAADHPCAWFREAHSAERIATPSADNRYVGYPYTKLMNAIMMVDQAAALVMTTEATAEQLGISRERWVYPMGGAELDDVWHVTERPQLHRSPAIRTAGRQALEQAGIALEDITAFDLYSCFPAAVELALEALDLAVTEPRPLTLTGGLPYFGGAGNNYAMHAVATAVERIREHRDERVLVSALGWYCTKHAVGVYGSEPPRRPWQPRANEAEQAAIDATALPCPLEQATGRAHVEALVIRHGRDGGAADAVALLRMENGRRALATIDASPRELEAMEQRELVGAPGEVRPDADTQRNRVCID